MQPFAGFDVTQRNGSGHPNPMFDYLSGMVPHRLKQLFQWGEYLATNSAHIYAVVKTFGEFPITHVEFTSSIASEREKYKNLFERKLNVKGFLTQVSFDKFVYGNSFVSMHTPIYRMLECPYCHTVEKADVANYTFSLTNLHFTLTCREPRCKRKGIAKVRDEKNIDPSKISLIRWDPKDIDIKGNPVTGERVYYYNVPRDLVNRVRQGDRLLTSTMPMELLAAMRDKTVFRFGAGEIYHVKVPGPAGLTGEWGLPPLISAIKLFMFTATLRKANEAIALEHITPFRIIHPAAGSSNGDPLTTINLGEWRNEFVENYKKFRRDPLHIMTSPVPMGVQNVGGEGRALLTLGEIQEADKTTVLAFGVPIEFIAGGLGAIRGETTLRVVENKLQVHVEDLNGLVQWIADKSGEFMGWDKTEAKLADFKMLDNDTHKGSLFQLWSSGKLDDTTLFNTLSLDRDAIRQRIRQEAIDAARDQMALDKELNQIRTSLSAQAQQKAQMGQNAATYDVQAVIAQADAVAQEFAALDPGSRRSRMQALKVEDLVLASVVRERLEQLEQNNAAAAKAQQ